MRVRFEQQLHVGILPISEIKITTKTRDAQPKMAHALLKIYNTPAFNEQIFALLESSILRDKKQTGRKGMDLWQIFVLSQFKIGLNLSYDRLHTMCNTDKMLRQLLGIEASSGFFQEEISYQTLLDNINLLDEDLLKKINNVIVEFGHKEVFKKKEEEALLLKTDSFVVESNVHFPTDYSLLFDSARKCLSVLQKILVSHSVTVGWRNFKDWEKKLKVMVRQMGQANKGKNATEKVKVIAQKLLDKAQDLLAKLEPSIEELRLSCKSKSAIKQLNTLIIYTEYLQIHIDLLERRIIKGETIPHADKMFSVFETYTEWINKGKQNPSVELGKRLVITTDQCNLIVDHQVMNKTTDSEVVKGIHKRISSQYAIARQSFDKGFYSKANKEYLKLEIASVVMPKKGKCNLEEALEEKSVDFKKARNQHSAVESNINELEHRGLGRCRNRGQAHFDNYIALGVCAYNLHKIGARILKDKQRAEKSLRKIKSAA